MKHIGKIGLAGALIFGTFAGLQAEEKNKRKLRREWFKNNAVIEDKSRTQNEDGSVTRTLDATLTTKKGNEIDVDREKTVTKNDDGSRSFSTLRTGTSENGSTRTRQTDGTVTRNGDGTSTISHSSSITRRDGSTTTHEGSKTIATKKKPVKTAAKVLKKARSNRSR